MCPYIAVIVELHNTRATHSGNLHRPHAHGFQVVIKDKHMVNKLWYCTVHCIPYYAIRETKGERELLHVRRACKFGDSFVLVKIHLHVLEAAPASGLITETIASGYSLPSQGESRAKLTGWNEKKGDEFQAIFYSWPSINTFSCS